MCHKLGVMRRSQGRKPRPPLDGERLNELALFYVGRYATTRAKLSSYLSRKIRERGWNGDSGPDIERLVERFAETGLVDDASFALAKSRSLSERGYGRRRVRQALRAAGIEEADGEAAHELAAEQAVDAALRFARRRRIGPFAALFAHPATAGVPFVLETPGGDEATAEDLVLLAGLRDR